MVIVVVRDENLADAATRHPRQSELARDAVSGVNNVRLIVDNEDVSRLCASFVLRRATLRTQGDQRRLRGGLLSEGNLWRRRDEESRAEDKSNRERGTNGGSRMDHAVAPEEAWGFSMSHGQPASYPVFRWPRGHFYGNLTTTSWR